MRFEPIMYMLGFVDLKFQKEKDETQIYVYFGHWAIFGKIVTNLDLFRPLCIIQIIIIILETLWPLCKVQVIVTKSDSSGIASTYKWIKCKTSNVLSKLTDHFTF